MLMTAACRNGKTKEVGKMEQNKNEMEYVGYKFLTRELASSFDGSSWEIGVWRTQEVPEINRDGQACGVGLHLQKKPVPIYCPYYIGFYAVGKGLIGQDNEQMRFEAVKWIRFLKFSEIFYPGADLSGADLSGAYLTWANLTGADLSGAYLTGADLSGADLTGAHGLTGISGLSSIQKKQIHC